MNKYRNEGGSNVVQRDGVEAEELHVLLNKIWKKFVENRNIAYAICMRLSLINFKYECW